MTSSDAGVANVIADAGHHDAGTARDGGSAPPRTCDGPAELTLTNTWGPLEGPHQIYGRIDLGQTVPAGTRFQVAYRTFEDSGISTANVIESESTTEDTDELFYRIENVGNVELWIFARVDLDGNGRIGAGDIGGYYVGDPSMGVADGSRAPALVLMDASVCDADFRLTAL